MKSFHLPSPNRSRTCFQRNFFFVGELEVSEQAPITRSSFRQALNSASNSHVEGIVLFCKRQPVFIHFKLQLSPAQSFIELKWVSRVVIPYLGQSYNSNGDDPIMKIFNFCYSAWENGSTMTQISLLRFS